MLRSWGMKNNYFYNTIQTLMDGGDWTKLNVKIGIGKSRSTAGNSIKCHIKSIFGKPFCVAPNTCTSYCPPGLRPKIWY